MSGKYERLENYLHEKKSSRNDINLSFREIESIIGGPLPKSAYQYKAWWANQTDTSTRSQARAWQSAGYKVDAIQLTGKDSWVWFRSVSPAQTGRSKQVAGIATGEVPRITNATTRPDDQVCQSTIYLVSCVSTKRQSRSPARDMYISDWFIKARNYVQSKQRPWFILSAKYGLLHPDRVITPYEMTLKNMKVSERKVWAEKVIRQMDKMLPDAERIVLLAGQDYRQFLLDHLNTRASCIDIPMAGMRIGEQKQWLAARVRDAQTG